MNIRLLLPIMTISAMLLVVGCKPHKNAPPKQVAKGSPMRGAPMRAVKTEPDKPAETPKKEEAQPPTPPEKKDVKPSADPKADPKTPEPKLEPATTPEPKTDTKAQPLKLDDKKPDDGEENRIPRTNKKKKKAIDPKDYKKKFVALKDLKKGDKSLPPFLGFSVLSDFEYEIQWGVAKKDLPKQIPAAVLAWNGKKVRTRGYMLPLKMSEEGQVQTCFLLRDLGPCCFGGAPKMNYWVLITVPEGIKAPYKAYRSVEITGTISIGEKVEYDRVTSIYRMTATKVDWEE